MFTIYHSNKLDLLKDLAASIISSRPLNNPLQPEIILVQSTGMIQWMQIALATKFSIAANIEFIIPVNFIWQICTRILTDIPVNPCSKDIMTWRLRIILPKVYNRPEFKIINKYLREDNSNQRKWFQFASQVADLFEKYLLFRPEFIESWERFELLPGLGESQIWQAALWRELISDIQQMSQLKFHSAKIYQELITTLNQINFNFLDQLPERIFICGISTFPPIYLKIFQSLAQHIDIHWLFTNPCQYYWGDVLDSKLFFNNDSKHIISNPLLASWGKLGRENLYLISQLENINEVDAFIEPTANNLLSLLQRDILKLENYAVIDNHKDKQNVNNNKRPLRLNDRSISIHVCHSPQREVEVLYDNLLAMMEEDPSLSARDVIVMVSNIDNYTPAIHAVFGNINEKRSMPFYISNKKLCYTHSILPAFLNLLDITRSRFNAEQVLNLLEVTAIATRFQINESGLKLLRHWVVESGIRWGLDDDTHRKLLLPTSGQYTWQFGLTRMLLGYAMDSQNGDWEGILPYDESRGLIADLVGNLAELLIQLRRWRDYLKQSRTLKEWFNCITNLIKDFFSPCCEEKKALTILINLWQQMLQAGIDSGYDELISITVLYDELITKLNQEEVHSRFVIGKINFCTFMSMRSIPFKVICLLGMNDGYYPSIIKKFNFDLMAENPRPGDYCRIDDERYLFLEACLSATQRFYISFIGCSMQDNTLRYPSLLVRELTDYIAHSFYLLDDQQVDNVANVRKHLWQLHSRMPFAIKNFIPGYEYHSVLEEWLPAANMINTPVKSNMNFVKPLEELSRDLLSIDELKNFFRHPIRYWFEQRLLICFLHEIKELPVDEPFVLDKFTQFKVNNKIVNALINEQDINKLYSQIRASGWLPYGTFGELSWNKQYKQMEILTKQIQKYHLLDKKNIDVVLTIDKTTISGLLPQVQSNGLLRWSPKILSIKDGLLLWLEHLIYCAIGGIGDSRMFGTNCQWHFYPLSIEKSKEYLRYYIDGYYHGMSTPLMLLNYSGGEWLKKCFDYQKRCIDFREITQRKARETLIQSWNGNNFKAGDSKDRYLQRLIYKLEEQHITAIIQATQQYLLPLFLFNKAGKQAQNHKLT